jgi:hypothetical protein
VKGWLELGSKGKKIVNWERKVVNWGGLKTEFVSGGPEPRACKNFFDFLSRTYPPIYV